ncbi:MAG TPA: DinB family protein [Gemmatimonadales bacterium]|nr:DinB family protein [Gemmatimonadales bacterium]
MSESRILADQVARVHTGDPWYGDPITKVLDGISARSAAAYPIRGAHSIWELVLHLTTWVKEVNRRLESGVWREPEDGDWPSVPEPTEANWRQSLERLDAAHTALEQTVKRLSARQLAGQIGVERDRALGTGVTLRETIHGILQHDAYHLGQIALLKKASSPRA